MKYAAFPSSLGITLGLLTALGSLSTLCAQDYIVWEKDINTALAKAKATERLVFIHFHGDDCAPCKLMESEVFPNRQVIADMNRFFVPVRVNTSLNPQLRKQFDVSAIPTDVILKSDGQFVHRRQGGISAERFAVYLNYINEEAGAKPSVVVQEMTLPVPALENRTVVPPPPAQSVPQNPWDVTAVPTPIDSRAVGLVPPQPPPMLAPLPNGAERNNPVRTGFDETAATPKGLVGSPREIQAIHDEVGVSTVEVPLALEGFCPVTLSTQERWQTGNPLYYGMYQGQIFRCVNEEALITFFKDPAKYAPVAMGDDIVQMVNRNKKIIGQRKFGAWFQDRVYLFSSQESLDMFAAKPEFYAEIALKYETALRPRFDAVQR